MSANSARRASARPQSRRTRLDTSSSTPCNRNVPHRNLDRRSQDLAGRERATSGLDDQERLFRLACRQIGDSHPDTLVLASDLGLLYQESGELHRARELAHWTYERRQRALGPQHPETLVSLWALGSALAAQGRVVDARQALGEAADGLQMILGPSHPYTIQIEGHIQELDADIALDIVPRGNTTDEDGSIIIEEHPAEDNSAGSGTKHSRSISSAEGEAANQIANYESSPEELTLHEVLFERNCEENPKYRYEITHRNRLQIAAELAERLQALHSQGEKHLNLQASSVRVKLGVPPIGDPQAASAWWYVLSFVDSVQTPAAATNFEFMSPEVARWKTWSTDRTFIDASTDPITPKADVFSLGILLWCLCSRQEPCSVSDRSTVPNDSQSKTYLFDGWRPAFAALQHKQLLILAKLAKACWHYSPDERPTIGHVCSVLSNTHAASALIEPTVELGLGDRDSDLRPEPAKDARFRDDAKGPHSESATDTRISNQETNPCPKPVQDTWCCDDERERRSETAAGLDDQDTVSHSRPAAARAIVKNETPLRQHHSQRQDNCGSSVNGKGWTANIGGTANNDVQAEHLDRHSTTDKENGTGNFYCSRHEKHTTGRRGIIDLPSQHMAVTSSIRYTRAKLSQFNDEEVAVEHASV